MKRIFHNQRWRFYTQIFVSFHLSTCIWMNCNNLFKFLIILVFLLHYLDSFLFQHNGYLLLLQWMCTIRRLKLLLFKYRKPKQRNLQRSSSHKFWSYLLHVLFMKFQLIMLFTCLMRWAINPLWWISVLLRSQVYLMYGVSCLELS